MKVMDFLDTKGDAWGIKYYNAVYNEYTPCLQDNIIKIKFLKSDKSGSYHIYTDSDKDVTIDKMTISDIKKYCAQATDCERCLIHEFCLNAFCVIPRKW